MHEFPTNGVIRKLNSRDKWSAIRNQRMTDKILPMPNALIPILDYKSDKLLICHNAVYRAQITSSPVVVQAVSYHKFVMDLIAYVF